ncbi:MAG TPA: hypothetical protein VMZ51_05740 [Acidimicrobiales bacterium]|nr:hypothetical protein [Acidimicrobiales bacterium]
MAAAGTLALAPTVVTVARGGHELLLAFVTAAVVGGAGLAQAVDDDAAVLLASAPTSLARRRAGRLAVALIVMLAAWLGVAVAGALGGGLDQLPIRRLVVEAVTAAGIGIAVAAATARRGVTNRPGLTGALMSVVTMVTITLTAEQYGALPRLGDAAHHGRWLWLAAAAWLAAAWASRDPARAPGVR